LTSSDGAKLTTKGIGLYSRKQAFAPQYFPVSYDWSSASDSARDGGADFTLALPAVHKLEGERQIQSSTIINILLVVFRF
jgi:hypothetical protein